MGKITNRYSHIIEDIFLEKYEKLTDIKEFTKYSVKPLTKSIRVNTLKISVSENSDKKRRRAKGLLAQNPGMTERELNSKSVSVYFWAIHFAEELLMKQRELFARARESLAQTLAPLSPSSLIES